MSGSKRKTTESRNIYKHKNSRFLQMEFEHEGKTYRKSSKTTSRRKAATKFKEWKAEILAQLGERPTRLMPDMTFGEAAEIYWNEQGANTRDADALDRQIAIVVQMVGADKMCSTFTRGNERKIRSALRNGELDAETRGKGRPKKVAGRYAARTINAYTGLINRILNWAEIFLETKFPHRSSRRNDRSDTDREIERPRYRHMSFEEQWRLRNVIDPDTYDAVLFAIDTGIREYELCELTWSAIDWSLCTVTFPLKGKGLEPKMHTVDLTEDAMTMLNARALYESDGVTSEKIFMVRTRRDHRYEGRRRCKGELIDLNWQSYYKRFKKACKDAEIDDLTIHDLRRTAGRRVYEEEGSDIEAARALLGHTDVRQTQDYLGVTGVAINPHLRKRSARAKLALAELDAAAAQVDPAPGTRAHVLKEVLSRPAARRRQRVY